MVCSGMQSTRAWLLRRVGRIKLFFRRVVSHLGAKVMELKIAACGESMISGGIAEDGGQYHGGKPGKLLDRLVKRPVEQGGVAFPGVGNPFMPAVLGSGGLEKDGAVFVFEQESHGLRGVPRMSIASRKVSAEVLS